MSAAVARNEASTGRGSGGITGKGFKPGQSGNVNGRAKGLAKATRELVGDDGVRLAEFWVDILEDTEAKMADRLEASRLLADRGWGKAASFAPIEEDDPLGITGAHDRLVERLARVVPLPGPATEAGR
jgi:hypothetical protein